MARLHFFTNTANSRLGFLSPLDLEIVSTTIDLFYFVCLKRESGIVAYRGNFPVEAAPQALRLDKYMIEIEVIRFENPLEVSGFLKNITVGTANWVLERTIFYQHERLRRKISNELAYQQLIEAKLRNAEKAVRTRKKLIKGGLSEEEATKLLADLLNSQDATLRVSGPKDRT